MAISMPGGLGGIAGKLIWNVVTALGIAGGAIALFFIGRAITKFRRKQKSFTIDASISDLNGVIEFDKMGFLKNDETQMLEMIFEKRKADSIPPIPKHLVRNGKCLLLNFAPGHYAVVDPSATISNFNQGINKIVLYNLGMKKYIISKQREMLNKADASKKKWNDWLPWIALTSGILGVCLLIFIIVFFGGKMYSSFIADRITECKATFSGVQ